MKVTNAYYYILIINKKTDKIKRKDKKTKKEYTFHRIVRIIVYIVLKLQQ